MVLFRHSGIHGGHCRTDRLIDGIFAELVGAAECRARLYMGQAKDGYQCTRALDTQHQPQGIEEVNPMKRYRLEDIIAKLREADMS